MISIVIPSWNGCHLLKTLIPSILEQITDGIGIIVVDNGSSDATCEWLRTCHPGIKVIMLPENRGFSGAVNEGIKACGNDDVILVNNDTIADQGWLSALVSARNIQNDTHIFASRIVHADPPHAIDTAGDGFTIAGFGYKIGWLEPDGPAFDSPREVFAASGCSVLIRRAVFDTTGLFDEDFFAFGEDLDFCFRARLAGFGVQYVPDAKIFHTVRATASGSNTLFWYHRNLVWLLCKNLPAVLVLLYWPHIVANFVLIAVRSVIRGWSGLYLKSLTAAFRGMPAMMVKRHRIQKQRVLHVNRLRTMLDANWIAVHINLHRAHIRHRTMISKNRPDPEQFHDC